MTADETPLEMVHRHIVEGEGHIARQLMILEKLRSTRSASEISEAMLGEAEVLLDQFRETQSAHVAHLAQIREDQGAGLRDADGNLSLP